jgi:hypothetical protein
MNDSVYVSTNGYRQRSILLEMRLGNVYPRERERVFQSEGYDGYRSRLRIACLRGFGSLQLGVGCRLEIRLTQVKLISKEWLEP